MRDSLRDRLPRSLTSIVTRELPSQNKVLYPMFVVKGDCCFVFIALIPRPGISRMLVWPDENYVLESQRQHSCGSFACHIRA